MERNGQAAMTFMSQLEELQSRFREVQHSLDQLHTDFRSLLHDVYATPSYNGFSAIPDATHQTTPNKPCSEECPHVECAGITRTRFNERKNLIRHYTSHIKLDNEVCIYCQAATKDGNRYIAHLNGCKSKATASASAEAVSNATRRRKELLREAGDAIAESLPRVKGSKRKRYYDRNQLAATPQRREDAIVTLPPTQVHGQTGNSGPREPCSRHAAGHTSEEPGIRPGSHLGTGSLLSHSDAQYTIGNSAQIDPIRPAFTGYPIDLDEDFEVLASYFLQDGGLQANLDLQPPTAALPRQFTLASPRAAYANQQTFDATFASEL
ncbi:hypothetical protein BB8028_0002g05720 [Beauveria bassiana]|uniref:C2H2-type domain-containing protein n=1 Tax=Beauveria bassiana TaxID=176275 RepID=A0A2S7Y280_BEABA|nr:hypothetical protein BB8028_0002g05720 [Beauveria bassiana]